MSHRVPQRGQPQLPQLTPFLGTDGPDPVPVGKNGALSTRRQLHAGHGSTGVLHPSPDFRPRPRAWQPTPEYPLYFINWKEANHTHTRTQNNPWLLDIKPENPMVIHPATAQQYGVKDGDLVMEANQQYWGGAPAFEKVIIRTVPEASTRVSALMSGQADVTVAVPAEQGEIVNRSGRARVEHVTSNRFGWWRMNSATHRICAKQCALR